MTYSRLIVALISLSLTACSVVDEDLLQQPEGPPGPPIDGPFILKLTELRSVCTGGTDQPYHDITVEVDVLVRQDGLIDIRHSTNKLPGALADGRIAGVAVNDGEIHVDEHTVAEWGSMYTTIIDGVFTPDKVSFDYQENIDLYTNGELSDECMFSGHAEGRRRAINDPTRLDGFYDLTVSAWDLACAETRSDTPNDVIDGELDIIEDGNGDVHFILNDRALMFSTERPDEDGNIDFDGTMYFPYAGEIESIEGTVDGTLAPNGLDLDVFYSNDDMDAECGVLLNWAGDKRMPDPKSLVNDYRLQYDVTGTCFDNEVFNNHARIVEQNGNLYLDDSITTTLITVNNGELQSVDGEDVVISGTVEPPHISYVVTRDGPHPNTGEPCNLRVEVEGKVRYLD